MFKGEKLHLPVIFWCFQWENHFQVSASTLEYQLADATFAVGIGDRDNDELAEFAVQHHFHFNSFRQLQASLHPAAEVN